MTITSWYKFRNWIFAYEQEASLTEEDKDMRSFRKSKNTWTLYWHNTLFKR